MELLGTASCRGPPPSIRLFSHLKGLCSKCLGNNASPNNPVGRRIESRISFALAYFIASFSITVLAADVNFPELYCSNSSDQCSTSFLNGCEGIGFVLEVEEHTTAVWTLFLLAASNIFKHPSTVGFIISVFPSEIVISRAGLPLLPKYVGMSEAIKTASVPERGSSKSFGFFMSALKSVRFFELFNFLR